MKFSFYETFVIDPTGEISENIIVEELRAAAETPGAFCFERPLISCRTGRWIVA
jgi:hypothetical protein